MRDRAPKKDSGTLAFTALWLLLAAIAASGSVALLISGLPVVSRALLSLLLALGSVLALMLASEGAARWLDGRLSRWGDALYWLATSLVTLTVVVMLGAVVTLAFRDKAGSAIVARDFGLDLLVGVVAGALAAALIMALGVLLGRGICWLAERLGLSQHADLWRAPAQPSSGAIRAARLRHGAALGTAGLLASALFTALATRDHTRGADAPAPTTSSVLVTIIVPLLLWAAATAAVWIAWSRRHAGPRGEHVTRADSRMRHGTHATALAILLLAAAGSFAAIAVRDNAEGELWDGSRAVRAVTIQAGQWSDTSSALAQRFEPQLWLTGDEHWSPTSVSWYMHQGEPPDTAPARCKPYGCLQIRREHCDGADPPVVCAPSGSEAPALYYRYVDKGEPDGRPAAPAGSWKLIQYWIFYNYDSLKAGAVTQWHQGDWEQVSVLLRHEGNLVTPVEVAYSEHCYGVRLPAERVRWTGATHPVVFVGKGSHANYPRPVSVPVRQLRCYLGVTSRYFGVGGLFFAPAFDGTGIEVPFEYLIGLRDHPARARSVPGLPLLRLDATPAVSSFKSYWGLDNNLRIGGLISAQTGPGPPAPPEQNPWKHPFDDMLCSGKWLTTAPRDAAATSWVCQRVGP